MLAAFDQDWEFLAQAVELWRGLYPRRLGDLAQAQEQRQTERFIHEAHALKGEMAHFERGEAFQAAMELERLGRAGRLDLALPLILTLRGQVEALSRDLGRLLALAP
jgi:HPt (histidine-containing phosphotransfer) domain-containing protein